MQGLIERTIALFALGAYGIVNLAAMTLGLVPSTGHRPEAPRRNGDLMVGSRQWRRVQVCGQHSRRDAGA